MQSPNGGFLSPHTHQGDPTTRLIQYPILVTSQLLIFQAKALGSGFCLARQPLSIVPSFRLYTPGHSMTWRALHVLQVYDPGSLHTLSLPSTPHHSQLPCTQYSCPSSSIYWLNTLCHHVLMLFFMTHLCFALCVFCTYFVHTCFAHNYIIITRLHNCNYYCSHSMAILCLHESFL